ncbi:lipopolysaccharide biosynthesis protein [Candidatus Enterococcus ferrettii]|uniref:Polysaccharide biosynthesis protein C-terminal domain-containing protein n=1 Tax=Candidatus Enterococcus ferrettii TaxID=2815324 RepID=A0ABV0EIF3_9ENTE|nr:polysaccharide biosynthesis C-terminal domain-containing protein [Enterococcus sp. 665A]
MMNQYKKLVNDSLILAIGSFGSKLITFFLVGFYTYYLTTAEYGMADLLLNSINLALPIVSLSISEGVLRFTLDSNQQQEKEKLLHTALKINSWGIGMIGVILLGSYFLIGSGGLSSEIWLFSFCLLVLQSFQLILMQYIKGMGKLKVYAANGILLSLLTLLFGFLLFRRMQDKLTAYFCSLALANGLSLIFLLGNASLRTWPTKANCLNKDQTRQLIKYSLPLIPNSAMWWVLTTSSRFIMTFFLGVASNGMYAAASKVPNLLSVVGSIFLQAWQLSAVENHRKKNASVFAQRVFNYYSTLLIVFSSCILLFLDPLASILLSKDFYYAKAYIPLLLISNFFSCISGFFGTTYIVVKKTHGVLTTSLVGAGINLIASWLLIPFIGINGASLASALGFFVIFYLRKRQTRQLTKSQLSTKRMNGQVILLLLQIGLLYWSPVTKGATVLLQVLLLIFMGLIGIVYQPVRKE